MSPQKGILPDTNHAQGDSRAKLIGNWLTRWPVWLYLLARDLPDMAEYAAMKFALLCSLGTTALLLPLVGCLVVESHYIKLVSLGVGALVYLAIGLLAFFTSPNTNAPVHWSQNGPW